VAFLGRFAEITHAERQIYLVKLGDSAKSIRGGAGRTMKLITWNCNGALRDKKRLLDSLDADILVVQECEDPAQSNSDYRDWAGSYHWKGYGKNKGIGIFARRGQSIEPLQWDDGGFELFLPVRIGNVDVVGVWTQSAKPSKFGYIGQFWHYFQMHKHLVDPQTIFAGDFNSNAIWDKPRGKWNHLDCVRDLAELGFHSLYHHFTGEDQGVERQPTYFQYRHEDKPFHIDFIFAHEALIGSEPKVQIGAVKDWLALSDHLPVITDLNFTV
jgi:exonuclease III